MQACRLNVTCNRQKEMEMGTDQIDGQAKTRETEKYSQKIMKGYTRNLFPIRSQVAHMLLLELTCLNTFTG